MTSLGFRFSSPSPPTPCSSLKPCWPALRIGPACKMAPARMLMMLSRRAAWNAPKPSLCWGSLQKRVFGTLTRCAAPRRPGEKRRSHEARSAALCARPLLLRSRPFMARALAGHQKNRAALAPVPPTPKPTPKLNRLKPSTQDLSFVLQWYTTPEHHALHGQSALEHCV